MDTIALENPKIKGDLSGYWSVRIDDKNRIVFRIINENIEIAQCGSHYRDNQKINNS